MPFEFQESPLKGVLIIKPHKFSDDRGFFMETYKKSDYLKAGITEEFIQDNHSHSSRGVLRGIHFQSAPHAQGKLVRVVKGAVWDVSVDLIKGSPTFGQHFGVELNEENGTMLYVPPGFGHGFLTLKDNTHLLYKCSAEYAPESDGGVIWNDSELAVQWPLEGVIDFPFLSEKDSLLPALKDVL